MESVVLGQHHVFHHGKVEAGKLPFSLDYSIGTILFATNRIRGYNVIMNFTVVALLLSFTSLVGAISTFILFINLKKKLHFITSKNSKQSLDEIIGELLAHLQTTKNNQEQISHMIRDLETRTKTHVQRMGLVRFNPFADTGGDQSFTLAILDGHNSGFVISSLHSRDHTRIFAKPVVSGKGDGFELSFEEQLAIRRANTP